MEWGIWASLLVVAVAAFLGRKTALREIERRKKMTSEELHDDGWPHR